MYSYIRHMAAIAPIIKKNLSTFVLMTVTQDVDAGAGLFTWK